jgi:uncharacterized protein (AIM24 family)
MLRRFLNKRRATGNPPDLKRETAIESLKWGDQEVLVRRRPYYRKIKIQVQTNGSVVITAGALASEQSMIQFLLQSQRRPGKKSSLTGL